MPYKCVIKSSDSDLEKAVNQLIDEGWKLQGGVSVSICQKPYYIAGGSTIVCMESFCYAQGMVKEEEK